MPQKPDVIATRAISGEVLIWDRTKHTDEPDRNNAIKPEIRLVGQTREGLVVAFSKHIYIDLDISLDLACRGIP